jgi:hypothetical protein
MFSVKNKYRWWNLVSSLTHWPKDNQWTGIISRRHIRNNSSSRLLQVKHGQRLLGQWRNLVSGILGDRCHNQFRAGRVFIYIAQETVFGLAMSSLQYYTWHSIIMGHKYDKMTSSEVQSIFWCKTKYCLLCDIREYCTTTDYLRKFITIMYTLIPNF